MVYRLLENLALKIMEAVGRRPLKCEQCKTPMERLENPPLFLLPLFHDDSYKPTKAFYLSRCVRIDDVSQIPTGQRACRFWTFRCPKCGYEEILAEDFLQVRGSEVIESRSAHPNDAEFRQFLSESAPLPPESTATTAPNTAQAQGVFMDDDVRR